jgi:hypothetical protein
MARILLVENSKIWRARLEDRLHQAVRSAEIQVESEYEGGRHALREGGPWDLLVTDIGLPPATPELLGEDLLEEAARLGLPAIIVSGTVGVTPQIAFQYARRYGARAFFGKAPFDAEGFIAKVCEVLVRPPPPEVECLVTLDQVAALVNRSKRSLEHYKSAMPPPRVKGGPGQPDEWSWAELRPWLEEKFHRRLPERFPARRRP